MTDRLSDTYWELQTEDDPVGLEEFTDRAVAGKYGQVTREDLRVFLRAVEARLIHQLERGESGPHDATTREERIEETRGWIEDLITKFCED